MPGDKKHRRDSRWTTIYFDVDPATKEMRPYVRLTPDFLDLEAAGRPHGLSVGGARDDRAEAERFADSVDAFMEAIAAGLMEKAAS